MKVSIFVLFIILNANLGAISFQQAIYDINYWNIRYAAISDSIHISAQMYYQIDNIFSYQTKSESSDEYIIRVLNAYSKVKKMEFDAFLPSYSKMFEVYAREVVIPEASILLGSYDSELQKYSLDVVLHGRIVSSSFLKLPPDKARQLMMNWDSCTKTVYGTLGISSYPKPSRIFIISGDRSLVHNEVLAVVDHIDCAEPNSVVTPIRNRTSFIIESSLSPPYLFNPAIKDITFNTHKVQYKNVCSNLMSNRGIGFSAQEDTSFVSLLKLDLTFGDNPVPIQVTGDDKVPMGGWKNCRLSPEGRLIFVSSKEGIDVFDFETSKLLKRIPVRIEGAKPIKSFCINPFDKTIYYSDGGNTYTYSLSTGKVSQLALNAVEIQTDNAGLRLAYWNESKPEVSLLYFETRNILSYRLPELTNTYSENLIRAIDFSPDDRLLAVLSIESKTHSARLHTFDTKTSTLMRSFDLPEASSIVFTKDGQNILCSSVDSPEIMVVHLGIQTDELK